MKKVILSLVTLLGMSSIGESVFSQTGSPHIGFPTQEVHGTYGQYGFRALVQPGREARIYWYDGQVGPRLAFNAEATRMLRCRCDVFGLGSRQLRVDYGMGQDAPIVAAKYSRVIYSSSGRYSYWTFTAKIEHRERARVTFNDGVTVDLSFSYSVPDAEGSQDVYVASGNRSLTVRLDRFNEPLSSYYYKGN